MSPSSGKIKLLILCSAFYFAGAAVFLRPGLCDLSGDSARYFLLARAIAQGQGFVDLEKPGRPAHTEYGPGLPFLLAPLVKIFPRSVLPGKVLMFLSLGLAIFFLYKLCGGRESESLGELWPAAALAGLSYLYRFGNQVLSDLPHLAASLAALWLALRAMEGAEGEREASGRWLAAGLVSAVAFLFRQTGIALYLGIAAGLWLDSGKSARARARGFFFFSLGFLLPAGLWLLRNYLAAGAIDSAHAAKLFMARDADPFAGRIGGAGLLARTGRGFLDYFRESAGILLDLGWALAPDPARFLVSFAFCGSAIAGLALRFKNRPGPLECFFIFYLFIICGWQSHNPRYLLPLLPLGFLFAAEAGEKAVGFANKRGQSVSREKLSRDAGLFLLGAAVLFNLAVLAADLMLVRGAVVTPRDLVARGLLSRDEGRKLEELAGEIHWGHWFQYGDWVNQKSPEASALRYHRLLACFGWMQAELPEDSLVMCRKPRLAAYYTGRRVIQFFPETHPDRFLAGLREKGVTHVVADEVSPGVRGLLDIFMQKKRGAVRPVFSIGRTLVLEVSERGE